MAGNRIKRLGATGRVAHWVWPAVIGCTTLLIWSFSLAGGEQSQSQSDTVRRLLEALLGEGAVSAFLLTHVRKVAHFTEYFVLGCEWACYRRVRPLPLVWLYGLPVAAADELLQFLSPGRGPAVWDVLLDTAGYLCGYWLTVGIQQLFARLRK